MQLKRKFNFPFRFVESSFDRIFLPREHTHTHTYMGMWALGWCMLVCVRWVLLYTAQNANGAFTDVFVCTVYPVPWHWHLST